MSHIEFIRLDRQPVRVTSLKADEVTGAIVLVIVVKGTSTAQQLRDLQDRSSILVEIPGQEQAAYSVTDLEWKTVGDGEQAMHRFALTLTPVTDAAEPPTGTETQLDRIERKLDAILARLGEQTPLHPDSPAIVRTR